MAVLTAAVFYAISVRGVGELLAAEERLRAARTATEFEQMLAGEIRILRAAATAFGAYPLVLRTLKQGQPGPSLATLIAQERGHSGVDMLVLHDAGAEVVAHAGARTDFERPSGIVTAAVGGG